MSQINLLFVVPEHNTQHSRQWVDNALGRTAQG